MIPFLAAFASSLSAVFMQEGNSGEFAWIDARAFLTAVLTVAFTRRLRVLRLRLCRCRFSADLWFAIVYYHKEVSTVP